MRLSGVATDELWLLAEWVISDAGAGVRGPLIAEAVRLIDALMTGECLAFLVPAPLKVGAVYQSYGSVGVARGAAAPGRCTPSPAMCRWVPRKRFQVRKAIVTNGEA